MYLEKFTQKISETIADKTMAKIILSNKRNKDSDLKTVHIKPVLLKEKLHLCFVYRHNTNDITKNYLLPTAFTEIDKLLQENFYQAVLQSTSADWHLLLRKNNSYSFKKAKPSTNTASQWQHNKQKNYLINAKNNVYLKALGISNASGNILAKKQKKFRQINKYVEIVNDILKPIAFNQPIKIADMGSGKGYLTFALYDFLKNTAKKAVEITGVELRSELVQKCNTIAKQAQFENLYFEQASIQDYEPQQIDVLIALHACDTATDDAIYKGIKANAEVIICAPCCHKQIRKQLQPNNHLQRITQFGILKERQAELLTDSLRALLLETQGYQTKVFEFIETEHTPKNVLIVATKKHQQPKNPSQLQAEIQAIKATYGIEHHYLEKLLGLVRK